ncbi:MAG: T9SS type A sorting domain-containing protein [Candidatus Cloacimonetes bacterium]|nr:T9SS type A sorting domain-containing protein [Candidatus Cloacimonadota bacterium]
MKRNGMIFFMFLICLTLMGRWIELNPEQESEIFECEQQTRGTAEVTFTLEGFELQEKIYDGETYSVISHDESGSLLDIGMPDLPVFTRALIIPDQGTATVEIISYEQREYTNVLVYPQEELQFENEALRDNFTINREFYQGRGIFPETAAWAGEPVIMRDFRVLPVTFCPFQYDAGSRTLTVYENISVQVSVEGSGGINAKNSERKHSRAFEALYRANTLNYDQLGLRDEYQVPTILFICNNDTSVLTNLAFLTEWKEQKGFNVVVATTAETGTTNTAIKNYIQDAYDNWENPPEYVNIMGDGSGTYTIPTWYSSGGYGEGDHPYSQLEGNDVLGDVILGRMTFSSIPMLQTVINKVLTYEKTPYMGNTAWYSRGLLVGDPSSSGYSCVGFAKSVKEMMLDFPGNFWGDDNFVEVYASPFASDMDAGVNLGVSYFAYRGYGGTSGWYSGNTANGYMMPFVVMPTCSSNNWQSGNGNIENFYQMGTTTTPNGGIGGMGTATSGTHTPFNNAIAVGVCGGIFRDEIFSMGGAVLQGKYYLWLTFPQNPSNYVDIFSHWNTLMGDGSLELWTRVPQNLSVTSEDIIPSGANFYEVAVYDSIGNAAEGAWVTLYGDDEEFVVSQFCNSSGMVMLDLDGASDGEYTLTVSKHDHIPFRETITLEQVDQYVDINSVSYDDASGNGNGIVNPGETVTVMLTLANTGSSAVSGVSAVLVPNSDYVTVLTLETVFGNMASGVTATGGFELEFSPALQGGMELRTEIIITDADDNTWVTWLDIPIEGASLYAESYTIDGDGVLDPGETDEIYFTLRNNGNLSAADIDGLLMCNVRRITISDSLGSFGNISAGGAGNNATNRFTVTASPAILPGTFIPFIIQLTNADGYDSYVTINVPIGEPGLTDPYGPDAYGYWCYDDGDTGYDKCPEYDWIEIDHDYGGDGISISWMTGPGTGTGSGTGTYANLELPEDFSLVFYGEDYDEICVSTNGWVAPGHFEAGNFMNYQIPGPQGPSPMIAVFWDDLAIGSGDVLWYYDEDLHYYVVQWSRITNGDTGAGETFQVILYDPVYYPTTTGDNEIKMQYLDVTNNNWGSYPSNHGQCSTVGLENENSQIGLQYTFNNSYPAACKPLTDNTALLFTPPPIPPDGPFINISNFFAYAGDDNFIEEGETAIISLILENMGAVAATNIEVELSINDPYITITDNQASYPVLPANGFASLENEFVIEVSDNVPDFYVFYLEAIISCDVDSWNWMLPFTAYWSNTFATDQDSIYFELQPLQTGSHEFTLSNIGSFPVNYYIRTDETTQRGRDISGSFITLDTDSFTPGEETTWTFTVHNAATDNEWLSDVWIDFPIGVSVVDAGNVIGGSGGEMLWDGTTGAGQRVNWHGLTANGWGVVHDGEIASWEVDVHLSTEFAGDMTLGWEIGGDGYGAEPHNVTGELYLLYPLRWINLDTSSGTLPALNSDVITVNFDSGDIEEGIHTGDIIITCDSWDTKIIHVLLNVSTVGEDSDPLPQVVELLGNYPNPFNPATELSFRIPEPMKVEMKIYNNRGQLVCLLADSYFPAGSHSLVWNGKDDTGKTLATGIYFYRLRTAGFESCGKMVMIK